MISNTDSTLLIYSTEHMRVKVCKSGRPRPEQAPAVTFPVTLQILRRSWTTHAPSIGATLKEMEAVLRRARPRNFTVGTYQRALMNSVLAVLDKFAEAVLLPVQDSLPSEDARHSQRWKEHLGHARTHMTQEEPEPVTAK